MKALVVSDCHLGWEDSDESSLYRLLDSERLKETSDLILLGDIFDLWRADKESVETVAGKLFPRLKTLLESGLVIHWVIGNHDWAVLASKSVFSIPIPNQIMLHRPVWLWNDRKANPFVFHHGDYLDFGQLLLRMKLNPNQFLGGIYDYITNRVPKPIIRAWDRLDEWSWVKTLAEDRAKGVFSKKRQAVDEEMFPEWETIQNLVATDMQHSRRPMRKEALGRAYYKPTPETWRTLLSTCCADAKSGTLVLGHFHEPRLLVDEQALLLDVGSWTRSSESPRNTFAEIQDGRIDLWSLEKEFELLETRTITAAKT